MFRKRIFGDNVAQAYCRTDVFPVTQQTDL